MSSKDQTPPLIQLIGEESENIYQLGLSDRDRHNDLFDQIQHFLTTDIAAIDKTTHIIGLNTAKQILERHSDYQSFLMPYSQGLNRPIEELAHALLLPELVSCLSKWAPGIPTTMLGCSSYITLDEQSNSPLHARVLDFPLAGPFEKEERVLRTNFKGQAQIASVGSAGVPFGSITGMNSLGATLALHQKFTPIQMNDGLPVFYIAQEVLKTCASPNDVLSYLKSIKGFTTWCLIMSFSQTNEILVVDIMGDKIFSQVIKIEPGEVYYFANDVLDKDFDQNLYAPYGLNNYNLLRRKNAEQKIKNFKKKASFSAEELLKLASTPLREHHHKTYKKIHDYEIFDTLTPSSLTINVLAAKKQEILGIEGAAPKVFQGEIYRAQNLFDDKRASIKSEKLKGKKVSKSYRHGLAHLIKAQTAFDRHDKHELYHHIQMAELEFKHGPLNLYVRFYKCIFDFIFMDHKKLRAQQLDEMLILRDQLNGYLKDQLTLFIIRTQRMLKGPTRFNENDIEHPMLKKIYILEKKIPVFALKSSFWKLINPRIDIMDVLNIEIKS